MLKPESLPGSGVTGGRLHMEAFPLNGSMA